MALAFDTIISGEALNTDGFEAFNTIEGIGLLSFGFLWPIFGIWSPWTDLTSTSWASFSDLTTTTWSAFSDVTTTIWTPYLA